jgi:2',3'-cyclic-nucleotide 2'-phosphodiesterase (5'-nucleotidase family)
MIRHNTPKAFRQQETKSALTDQSRAYFKEVNFSNAISDAMREYMKADVAIQNGGGIRSNIAKGDLTLYNVNEAFLFVNYVIEVEMNGKEIKQAIKHGIEKYLSGWNGGFPHIKKCCCHKQKQETYKLFEYISCNNDSTRNKFDYCKIH